MDEEIAAFVAERDRAFREGDIGWVKRMTGGASDEVAWAMLHRARYEVPAMGRELREASRRWLEERGLGRMDGIPWPAPGVLEE